MRLGIERRYKDNSESPDGIEFRHPLSDEWFTSLSACSLDYMKIVYERFEFKTKESN